MEGVYTLRKWIYLMLAIALVFGVFIYKEVHNPALPIKSVSKKEVIHKVNESPEDIVKIADEDGYQWYIAEKKGDETYDNLKKIMKEKGWSYKKQDDSRFVFQSEQGEITVLSRMWTKEYVIFYFPKEI